MQISTNITSARTLNIPTIIEAMRRLGRDELVHYAGASHRDLVAWHMTALWLDSPFASERVLKQRALKAAWGVDVALGDIVSCA